MWISGNTRLYKIQNRVTRERVRLHIEDKMREAKYRWFGYVKRGDNSHFYGDVRGLAFCNVRRVRKGQRKIGIK